MKTYTTTDACADFLGLIDDAATSREPIQITGKRGNVILVAQEDWRSIQETLYLFSVPGMRESIVDGMKTSVSECVTEVEG